MPNIYAGTVKFSGVRLGGGEVVRYPRQMTRSRDPLYVGYRYPAELISYAVWLYRVGDTGLPKTPVSGSGFAGQAQVDMGSLIIRPLVAMRFPSLSGFTKITITPIAGLR
jgi:hypothetical protein